MDINQDQQTNDNKLSNESVVEGSAGENETQPKGSGWGWGWSDLSSVWSSSVSAVTGSAQAISKGLGSVVAGVEETLGVPAPQEMARGDETISEEKGIANFMNAWNVGGFVTLLSVLDILLIFRDFVIILIIQIQNHTKERQNQRPLMSSTSQLLDLADFLLALHQLSNQL